MIAIADKAAVPLLALTVDQAAESLAVHRNTIIRLIHRGELRAVKIGPRGLRISVAEIQRWIEAQQEQNTFSVSEG